MGDYMGLVIHQVDIMSYRWGEPSTGVGTKSDAGAK